MSVEQQRTFPSGQDKAASNLLLEVLQNSWNIQTCLNCHHCDQVNDQCGKYKMKPPMNVVIGGCAEWECDIPF